MWSPSPVQKKPYFQIRTEYTILIQGQLFLVYTLKRRETKALLFCLGMQITRMSPRGIFHSVMYQTKF